MNDTEPKNDWAEVLAWLRGLGSSGADILAFLMFAGGFLANPEGIVDTAEAKLALTRDQVKRLATKMSRAFNAAFAPRFALVLFAIALEVMLAFMAVRGLRNFFVESETLQAYASTWTYYETITMYGCALVFVMGIATFAIRTFGFYLLGAALAALAHLPMGIALFIYAQRVESRELTIASTFVLLIGLVLTWGLAKLLSGFRILVKKIIDMSWPLVKVGATILPGITDDNVDEKLPEPDTDKLLGVLDMVADSVKFLGLFFITYMTTFPVIYPSIWLAATWFVAFTVAGFYGPRLCTIIGLGEEVADRAKTFYRWFYLAYEPTIIIVMGLYAAWIRSSEPSAIAMRNTFAMWKIGAAAVWAGISPIVQVEHWGIFLLVSMLLAIAALATDKPEKDKPSRARKIVTTILQGASLVVFLGFIAGVWGGKEGIHLGRDSMTHVIEPTSITTARTGQGEITATWHTSEPSICGVVVTEIKLPTEKKKYFDLVWEHDVEIEKAWPRNLPLEKVLLDINDYKEHTERTDHTYRFNKLASGLTVEFLTVCAKNHGEHAFEWSPSHGTKTFTVDEVASPKVNHEYAPSPTPSPAPQKATKRSPSPPPVRIVKLDEAPVKNTTTRHVLASTDEDCDE